VVAMGPGIVGTGSRWGFTGIEVASVLDAVAAVGGRPIATLRASSVDPRARHRGLSHHTTTTLADAVRSRVTVALPLDSSAVLAPELDAAGIAGRHDVRVVAAPDPVALFDAAGLRVTTMGRRAADDRLPFECAAAAGAVAVELLGETPPSSPKAS